MSTRAEYLRIARSCERERLAILEKARGRTLTRDEQDEYDKWAAEQRRAERRAQEVR